MSYLERLIEDARRNLALAIDALKTCSNKHEAATHKHRDMRIRKSDVRARQHILNSLIELMEAKE